jgi:hypothetical protein
MKLPKADVLKKLEASLRLLGRDRNTVYSYCRTAGHFYDYVRAQPPGRTSEQLDRATSPLEQFGSSLALPA